MYINQVEKAIKQLEQGEIQTDKIEMLNHVLYAFKVSGENRAGASELGCEIGS